MNLGMVGLGKIGLSFSLVLEQHGGHTLIGYDPNPAIAGYLERRQVPYQETGIGELLDRTQLKLAGDIDEAVAHADVVFLSVQTPHAPAYEGVTPVPDTRRDFEYAYLAAAARDICRAANTQGRDITLIVASTVLPGTCDRLIRPLLGSHVRLVYSPVFVAMSTTIPDFLNPEFILAGCDTEDGAQVLAEVYDPIHTRPIIPMSIASAELTKVAYNTFIGLKITFANALMELCHATAADVDDVTGALGQATNRLISPKYLTAGMGDGGGCHPRDNIAMSWLADQAGLSFDVFDMVAGARDDQTRWLAGLAVEWADLTGRPIVLLGTAYKPESNLTTGSPARLLFHMLYEQGRPAVQWDPMDSAPAPLSAAAVYVITTRHELFTDPDWEFPPGSVVLDPFGYIPDRVGVTVVRIGRKT